MFMAYKFRMYPNEDQKILIEKHIGSCRFIWNYFLDMRNKRYTETMQRMEYKEMQSLIPLLKHENQWLREINSQSLQAVVQNLDTAFIRFFKEIGEYPKFKKKNYGGSFTIPQHFKIDNRSITIPKFKTPLSVFMCRNIKGEVRNLTISKTSSGRYYVSILTEEKTESLKTKKIAIDGSIGIDVGIKEFLVLSDGTQIHNPKNRKKSEKLLVRRQRQLSKKNKGSKNCNKARIRVAKIHEHITNQRTDFHNKISDVILKQYDTVVVENLNVSGMLKNHHLSKSISDVGWSSFFAMLKAKASQRGKNVIEIGRFDPSSKMCSECGNIKHNLKLSDRIYHCNVCGLSIDRDLNAAINIWRFGLIKVGLEQPELTPVESAMAGYLTREGISYHSLKQEISPKRVG